MYDGRRVTKGVYRLMKWGPCTFALKGPNLTEFSKTFFSSSVNVCESYVKQGALYQNCKIQEKKPVRLQKVIHS